MAKRTPDEERAYQHRLREARAEERQHVKYEAWKRLTRTVGEDVADAIEAYVEAILQDRDER